MYICTSRGYLCLDLSTIVLVLKVFVLVLKHILKYFNPCLVRNHRCSREVASADCSSSSLLNFFSTFSLENNFLSINHIVL